MDILAFGLGGPTDVVIIAVVVLILFGHSKIGPWGKSMGEGIREFKKATKEEDTPVVENKSATAVTAPEASEEK